MGIKWCIRREREREKGSRTFSALKSSAGFCSSNLRGFAGSPQRGFAGSPGTSRLRPRRRWSGDKPTPIHPGLGLAPSSLVETPDVRASGSCGKGAPHTRQLVFKKRPARPTPYTETTWWRTSAPRTQKITSSAMLVAWSPIRSRLREMISVSSAWGAESGWPLISVVRE